MRGGVELVGCLLDWLVLCGSPGVLQSRGVRQPTRDENMRGAGEHTHTHAHTHTHTHTTERAPYPQNVNYCSGQALPNCVGWSPEEPGSKKWGCK